MFDACFLQKSKNLREKTHDFSRRFLFCRALNDYFVVVLVRGSPWPHTWVPASGVL